MERGSEWGSEVLCASLPRPTVGRGWNGVRHRPRANEFHKNLIQEAAPHAAPNAAVARGRYATLT